DYFTQEETTAIKPTWSWIGPDGSTEQEMRVARPARRKRSIAPTEGYGALLASMDDEDSEPSTVRFLIPRLVSGAFRVGSSYKVTASRSGYLYFAVNEVQSTDPDFNMFSVDNIGYFYAKVLVSSK